MGKSLEPVLDRDRELGSRFWLVTFVTDHATTRHFSRHTPSDIPDRARRRSMVRGVCLPECYRRAIWRLPSESNSDEHVQTQVELLAGHFVLIAVCAICGVGLLYLARCARGWPKRLLTIVLATGQVIATALVLRSGYSYVSECVEARRPQKPTPPVRVPGSACHAGSAHHLSHSAERSFHSTICRKNRVYIGQGKPSGAVGPLGCPILSKHAR